MKNIDNLVEKRAKEIVRTRHKVMLVKLINGSKKKDELCQEFGISRRTFYNWKRKYESEGIEGINGIKPQGKPRGIKP